MAKSIDDETMENVCILAKLSLSEEEKEKAKKIPVSSKNKYIFCLFIWHYINFNYLNYLF